MKCIFTWILTCAIFTKICAWSLSEPWKTLFCQWKIKFWRYKISSTLLYEMFPLCQVALGRPRDLLPCGFHSNTLWQISVWLFRRVCPIQPYFLRFISISISDYPVLSHSSWLVIIRGHQIPRMFRRHLLTVCHKPRFATIQQDRFDTGIEQLNFEVQVDVAWTPGVWGACEVAPQYSRMLC